MRWTAGIQEKLILLISVMVFSFSAFAEGEAQGDTAPKAQTIYVKMEPAFVTNYGSPRTQKLKYVKAEVVLRVSSPAAEAAVSRHMPNLRNAIVMLLSGQTDKDMASGEAQEMVRKAALMEVNKILKAEDESEEVGDLLFTNFIVQR